MKANSAIINIVILSISIIVGLLLLEFLIRIVGFEGEEFRQNVVFDKRYDRLFVDSWFHTAKFDGPEPYVDIRGQKVYFDKPSQQKRILFIGDSGIFGAGLALEHAIPARFAELINKSKDGSVQVINAGLTGTDQITQYNILNDKLLKLSPDVVVLGIFMANDITDNLLRVKGMENKNVYSIFNMLRYNSALFNFLYLRWQVLNAKYKLSEGDEEVRSVKVKTIDEDGIHLMNQYWGEIATYKQPSSHTINFAFKTLESILYRFKRMSLQQGFQLVVTFIPTYSQVTNEFKIIKRPLEFDNLRASGVKIRKEDLLVQKPVKRLKKICHDLEIALVDPIPQLRPLGANAFLMHDDHMSGEGAKALANALFQEYDPDSIRFRDEYKN